MLIRTFKYTLFVIFCIVCLPIAAKKWNVDNIPMVHLKNRYQYVCNPDNVLSKSTVDSVDCLLYSLEEDKGVQTVVVVVKQLEGDDPYSFGMGLGKRYGVGDKKQRSGLIIILATEDRSYQILTGNGLEGSLPDALIRRIQNRVMLPALKKGDWDAAILSTVKCVNGYLRGDNSLTAKDSEDDSVKELLLAFLFMALFLVSVYFFALQCSKRTCPKCGKRALKQVKQENLYVDNQLLTREYWKCKSCSYEETRDVRKQRDEGNHGGRGGVGGVWLPPIWGNGSGGSSSVGGGSFGGGSFGGGGSGGRF